jgi:L-ascorbate metabolism protein UlaG (beta-lactamase superfamily)
MTRSEAIVRYLYHSGFSVETPTRFLVFDYWERFKRSKKPSLSRDEFLDPDRFPKEKETIVFSSHSHPDHYDPIIWEWADKVPDIHYILSDDIKVDKGIGNMKLMSPYETYMKGDLTVKTYGSTDLGVSFFVQTDRLNIFHAGDLNMWYWYYESTEEELIEDRQKFIDEMEKMKDEPVDVAFFPVDPRLKEYYYLGGKYFIELMKPDLFVPMHFGDNYRVTKDFKQICSRLPVEIAVIDRKGQTIKYEKENV